MNIDEYVVFNKRILKLVGLYPINFLRYSVCILTIFSMLIPQIFQLYLGRNDIMMILETSSVLLTLILAVLKSFVWLWNNEITKLIEFLFADYWYIANSFDINNRMERYAKLGKNVTRGYYFLIINALLIFFTFQPLKVIMKKLQGTYKENEEEIKFPFPAAYPKFCYETPFYEITYISQTLASGFCGVLILAMDTLVATSLFHTCGHLQILHDNLSNLNNSIDQVDFGKKLRYKSFTKQSNVSSNDLHKRLVNLIKHHQAIIRFSDSMEKLFNPIMFLQVSASTLIICLVGFQVSSLGSKNYRLAEYFSYLAMALFQIVLFCWPGDEIICHSSRIGDAAFSMNWYNASNYIKKGIFLIILRSQKPNCLTAGKISILSMQSFATILNTSMSYFMLLRSFQYD